MPDATSKRCTKCGRAKPLEDFHKRAASRDGRDTRCKVCKRESSAAGRAANPDRARELTSVWHLAHVDRVREHRASWKAAHPGTVLADGARRRGASVVESFSIEELRDHLQSRGVDPEICIYCDTAPKEQWDHVWPIKLDGGHVIDNLAPACRACNRSKGAAPPDLALVARLAWAGPCTT